MRSVVLGLGISGRAVVDYLLKRGDEVIGVDASVTHEKIPVFSDSTPFNWEGVDLLVKSPGIPFSHPFVQAAHICRIPVMGEMDLAFIELQKRKKRVLGITGSNGKTTTTLLCTHLLKVSGQKAIATGNIGIPLLSQIEADADTFVVELSSFQLEHIRPIPVLDGALILNITPNHLDAHATLEDYARAKANIAKCLKPEAFLYVHALAASFIVNHPFQIFNFLQEKVETIVSLSYRDRRYPLYVHDWENLIGAYALTRVSDLVLKEGAESFVRPPHRLELVGVVEDVAYINDSKATSVDAVKKALESLSGPVVLIAGGVDKGGRFADWLPCLQGKVKKVLALGQAAGRIQQELTSGVCVDCVSSLQEAVAKAASVAQKGDTVLLSPGCSSYDQFKDYQHRGEAFKQLVEEINQKVRCV